jgi:hypothetical protein
MALSTLLSVVHPFRESRCGHDVELARSGMRI